LIFDVSLGIFVSSSRAAHENCDQFIAFGNSLWQNQSVFLQELEVSWQKLNKSEFNNQQSSIRSGDGIRGPRSYLEPFEAPGLS